MPIEKEFIHAGMRIKHPSGVTVTHALEDLQKLKEFNQRSIAFFQEQNKLIDADIARVKAAKKT